VQDGDPVGVQADDSLSVGVQDREQAGGQASPLRNLGEDEEPFSTRIDFWQNEPNPGDGVPAAVAAGTGTSAGRAPSAYMLLAAIIARSFSPRFSLEPRAQPHTHSAAVLINKHHARGLHRPADGQIIHERQ
jgi:hypothetical protein